MNGRTTKEIRENGVQERVARVPQDEGRRKAKAKRKSKAELEAEAEELLETLERAFQPILGA